MGKEKQNSLERAKWAKSAPRNLPHEYLTEGPALSAIECLQNAMTRIREQYQARVYPSCRISFEDFLRDVKKVQHKPSPLNQAGWYAMWSERSPLDGPVAFSALYTAGIYWYDAEHELLRGSFDRAWPALIRCFYFIGMACGPVTVKEGGSSGGKKAKEAKDPFIEPLKAEFKAWLLEQPDAQAESVAAIVRAFAPKADEFKNSWKEKSKDLKKKYPKSNPWNYSNVKVFLRGLYNDKEGEIRALIKTKLERPDAPRGRPRLKKHKSKS